MEMCRACMNVELNLIPLNESFINNYNLLTSLNVKLSDKLPQFCCQNCKDTVKLFKEFRDKSISSETTLQGLIESVKLEDQSTYPIDVFEEIETETLDVFEDYDTVDDVTDEQQEINEIKNFTLDTNIKIKTELDENKEERLNTIVPSKHKNKTKRCGGIKAKCKNDTLCCGICINKFEVLDELKLHLETHKTNKECEICHEDIISWPQLLGHRIKHLPAKQKKCYICNKRYATPSYMEYHYLIAHSDGQEKVLTCKICCRTYKTPNNLQKHLWSTHSEAKYFCDYCSKGFRTKCVLKKHIVVHLDYNTFSCTMCEYTCRSYGGLQTHKILMHCPSNTRCNKCFRYFETQEKCDKHKCKDSTLSVCPICGIQFQGRKKMTVHLKSHKRSFKCNRCPAVYKSSTALKVHVDRHNGNRTKKCEFCNAKFYSGSSLIKHRRIHTGEKPYVCEICNRGFTGNHNLKMHMRVHGQYLIVKRKKEDTDMLALSVV